MGEQFESVKKPLFVSGEYWISENITKTKVLPAADR